MIDAKHDDQRRCLVDLEHDAVGAASCRVQPGELPPQRPTDAMRIVEQRSEHELDDRCGDLVGKAVEVPRSGSGDTKLVATAAGHRDGYFARSPSPVT